MPTSSAADQASGDHPLASAELDRLNAYWRAANYLSVGQIYLLGNPLLREPLVAEHIKPRLLGHWGTTPGINLVWAHCNRWLAARPVPTLLVCGPGHGAASVYANAWLEGGLSACYPSMSRTEEGLTRLFRAFSMPYGLPSHAAPEAPGSLHEGGELGYSLAHAQGAALDCPGEQIVCIIGDGEAETGALAASWLGGRFLRAGRDASVLPVLHLNGWKIANPTVLARLPETDLCQLLRGYGYEPFIVAGAEPAAVHEAMAATLDAIGVRLDELTRCARGSGVGPAGGSGTARWPMVVLRTPKGWTGPSHLGERRIEGTFRAHQVPLTDPAGEPEQLELLASWLRSYGPDELFDELGAPAADLDALVPRSVPPMSVHPRANGGSVRRELDLPPFGPHAVAVPQPGAVTAEATP